MATTIVENWIREANLMPFLEMASWHVGAKVSPDDWIAIRTAIPDTDAENDKWFEYEFVGTESLHFELSRDMGTAVLHIHPSKQESST